MQKTKFLVNGEEVEYLHIEEKRDGTQVVTFEKKFNLITADMREIQSRLRERGLKAQVFKKLTHNIIMILFYDDNQVNGILDVLKIPVGSYEIDLDNQIITIDTPYLERKSVSKAPMYNYEKVKL